ncbi:hypothetical protein EDD18DRAFT_1429805 [Armillaria luteobubalina]|uniref:Uncharacterized protein n=1 Tax=Armillaria luteobubalina TaxID=153913 RepID=A0AA39PH56_9AGAR|nr:hypothetical protein EDD18DRAFT_1429805 [Armillaria luteobubalina]
MDKKCATVGGRAGDPESPNCCWRKCICEFTAILGKNVFAGQDRLIDDSSLSSESDGLPASPVLSTSTVQTTPSSPSKEVVLITLSPVLDTPRLFRPIPCRGDSSPVPDINEAEADEDLDYDPYYDKGVCFQEDDEASSNKSAGSSTSVILADDD